MSRGARDSQCKESSVEDFKRKLEVSKIARRIGGYVQGSFLWQGIAVVFPQDR